MTVGKLPSFLRPGIDDHGSLRQSDGFNNVSPAGDKEFQSWPWVRGNSSAWKAPDARNRTSTIRAVVRDCRRWIIAAMIQGEIYARIQGNADSRAG
jgi:hypothetical protein